MKFKAILAAVVFVLTAVLPSGASNAAPPQVQRGTGHGWINHYAPDDGYDTGFYTATNIDQYGRPYCPCYLINEGHNSTEYTPDVDAIFVYDGQEIWCLDPGGWVKWFDASGWHKVTDLFGGICVSRAD